MADGRGGRNLFEDFSECSPGKKASSKSSADHSKIDNDIQSSRILEETVTKDSKSNKNLVIKDIELSQSCSNDASYVNANHEPCNINTDDVQQNKMTTELNTSFGEHEFGPQTNESCGNEVTGTADSLDSGIIQHCVTTAIPADSPSQLVTESSDSLNSSITQHCVTTATPADSSGQLVTESSDPLDSSITQHCVTTAIPADSPSQLVTESAEQNITVTKSPDVLGSTGEKSSESKQNKTLKALPAIINPNKINTDPLEIEEKHIGSKTELANTSSSTEVNIDACDLAETNKTVSIPESTKSSSSIIMVTIESEFDDTCNSSLKFQNELSAEADHGHGNNKDTEREQNDEQQTLSLLGTSEPNLINQPDRSSVSPPSINENNVIYSQRFDTESEQTKLLTVFEKFSAESDLHSTCDNTDNLEVVCHSNISIASDVSSKQIELLASDKSEDCDTSVAIDTSEQVCDTVASAEHVQSPTNLISSQNTGTKLQISKHCSDDSSKRIEEKFKNSDTNNILSYEQFSKDCIDTNKTAKNPMNKLITAEECLVDYSDSEENKLIIDEQHFSQHSLTLSSSEDSAQKQNLQHSCEQSVSNTSGDVNDVNKEPTQEYLNDDLHKFKLNVETLSKDQEVNQELEDQDNIQCDAYSLETSSSTKGSPSTVEDNSALNKDLSESEGFEVTVQEIDGVSVSNIQDGSLNESQEFTCDATISLYSGLTDDDLKENQVFDIDSLKDVQENNKTCLETDSSSDTNEMASMRTRRNSSKDEENVSEDDENDSSDFCKAFSMNYKKESARFVCSCGFTSDENDSIIHLLTNHLIYKPYQCVYCKHTFVNKYYIKKHLKEIHKDEKNLKKQQWNMIGVKKAKNIVENLKKGIEYKRSPKLLQEGTIKATQYSSSSSAEDELPVLNYTPRSMAVSVTNMKELKDSFKDIKKDYNQRLNSLESVASKQNILGYRGETSPSTLYPRILPRSRHISTEAATPGYTAKISIASPAVDNITDNGNLKQRLSGENASFGHNLRQSQPTKTDFQSTIPSTYINHNTAHYSVTVGGSAQKRDCDHIDASQPFKNMHMAVSPQTSLVVSQVIASPISTQPTIQPRINLNDLGYPSNITIMHQNPLMAYHLQSQQATTIQSSNQQQLTSSHMLTQQRIINQNAPQAQMENPKLMLKPHYNSVEKVNISHINNEDNLGQTATSYQYERTTVKQDKIQNLLQKQAHQTINTREARERLPPLLSEQQFTRQISESDQQDKVLQHNNKLQQFQIPVPQQQNFSGNVNYQNYQQVSSDKQQEYPQPKSITTHQEKAELKNSDFTFSQTYLPGHNEPYQHQSKVEQLLRRSILNISKFQSDDQTKPASTCSSLYDIGSSTPIKCFDQYQHEANKANAIIPAARSSIQNTTVLLKESAEQQHQPQQLTSPTGLPRSFEDLLYLLQYSNGTYYCLKCYKNWTERSKFWWHLWSHLHKKNTTTSDNFDICKNCYDVNTIPKCHSIDDLLKRIESVRTQTKSPLDSQQPSDIGDSPTYRNSKTEDVCIENPELLSSTTTKIPTARNNSVTQCSPQIEVAITQVRKFIKSNKALVRPPGVDPKEFEMKKQKIVINIKNLLSRLEGEKESNKQESAENRLKMKFEIVENLLKKFGPKSPSDEVAFKEKSFEPQKHIELAQLASSEISATDKTPVELTILNTASNTKLKSKIVSEVGTSKLYLEPPQLYSCSLCKFSTLLQMKFKDHIQVHVGEELMCIHCGFITQDVDSFTKHFRSHASNISPNVATFFCEQNPCPRNTNQFKCNKLEDFVSHQSFYHLSDEMKCHSCQSVFSNLEDFTTHLQSNLLTIAKCPSCQAKATDKRSMLRHISKHHPTKGRMISITKHLICKERLLNNFDIKRVLRMQKEWQNSDDDNENNDDVQFIEYYPETSTPPFRKDLHCSNFTLLNNSQLPVEASCADGKVHIPQEKSIISHTDNPQVISAKTDKVQPSFFTDIPSYEDIHFVIDMGLMCTNCSYVAERKTNLDDHISNHKNIFKNDDSKNFCCMYCPSTFNELSEMENHLQHHDEKISFTVYKCSLDGFSTNLPPSLRSHLKLHQFSGNPNNLITEGTVILENKVVKCSQCAFKCIGKQSLIDHQKSHLVNATLSMSPLKLHSGDTAATTTEMSNNNDLCAHTVYPCPNVDHGEYFDSFDGHVSKLYVCENHAYSCKICSQIVKTKRAIHVHVGKHLKIPYICEICDFQEKQFNSLSTHMKSVHSVETVKVKFSEYFDEHIQKLLDCVETVNKSDAVSPPPARKRKFYVRSSNGSGIQTWPVDTKKSKTDKVKEFSTNPEPIDDCEHMEVHTELPTAVELKSKKSESKKNKLSLNASRKKDKAKNKIIHLEGTEEEAKKEMGKTDTELKILSERSNSEELVCFSESSSDGNEYGTVHLEGKEDRAKETIRRNKTKLKVLSKQSNSEELVCVSESSDASEDNEILHLESIEPKSSTSKANYVLETKQITKHVKKKNNPSEKLDKTTIRQVSNSETDCKKVKKKLSKKKNEYSEESKKNTVKQNICDETKSKLACKPDKTEKKNNNDLSLPTNSLVQNSKSSSSKPNPIIKHQLDAKKRHSSGPAVLNAGKLVLDDFSKLIGSLGSPLAQKKRRRNSEKLSRSSSKETLSLKKSVKTLHPQSALNSASSSSPDVLEEDPTSLLAVLEGADQDSSTKIISERASNSASISQLPNANQFQLSTIELMAALPIKQKPTISTKDHLEDHQKVSPIEIDMKVKTELITDANQSCPVLITNLSIESESKPIEMNPAINKLPDNYKSAKNKTSTSTKPVKIKFNFNQSKKKNESESKKSTVRESRKVIKTNPKTTSGDNLYQCPKCSFKTVFDEEVMVNHLEEHKLNGVYECNKCSAKFFSLDQIQNHQNFLHRHDENDYSILPVRCISLKGLFRSISSESSTAKGPDVNESTAVSKAQPEDLPVMKLESDLKLPSINNSPKRRKSGSKDFKTKVQSDVLKISPESRNYLSNLFKTPKTNKSECNKVIDTGSSVDTKDNACTSSKPPVLKRKSSDDRLHRNPKKSCVNPNSTMKCNYCDRGFSSLVSLSRHFSLEHVTKEQVLWTDVETGCVFNNKGSHVSSIPGCSHQLQFLCYLCHFRGKTRHLVKDHQKEKHGKSNQIIKLSEASSSGGNTGSLSSTAHKSSGLLKIEKVTTDVEGHSAKIHLKKIDPVLSKKSDNLTLNNVSTGSEISPKLLASEGYGPDKKSILRENQLAESSSSSKDGSSLKKTTGSFRKTLICKTSATNDDLLNVADSSCHTNIMKISKSLAPVSANKVEKTAEYTDKDASSKTNTKHSTISKAPWSPEKKKDFAIKTFIEKSAKVFSNTDTIKNILQDSLKEQNKSNSEHMKSSKNAQNQSELKSLKHSSEKKHLGLNVNSVNPSNHKKSINRTSEASCPGQEEKLSKHNSDPHHPKAAKYISDSLCHNKSSCNYSETSIHHKHRHKFSHTTSSSLMKKSTESKSENNQTRNTVGLLHRHKSSEFVSKMRTKTSGSSHAKSSNSSSGYNESKTASSSGISHTKASSSLASPFPISSDETNKSLHKGVSSCDSSISENKLIVTAEASKHRKSSESKSSNKIQLSGNIKSRISLINTEKTGKSKVLPENKKSENNPVITQCAKKFSSAKIVSSIKNDHSSIKSELKSCSKSLENKPCLLSQTECEIKTPITSSKSVPLQVPPKSTKPVYRTASPFKIKTFARASPKKAPTLHRSFRMSHTKPKLPAVRNLSFTPKRLMYRCPICSYSINKLYVYSRHLAKHTRFVKTFKKWKCSLCGLILSKRTKFDTHKCLKMVNSESVNPEIIQRVKYVPLQPTLVLKDVCDYFNH